MLAGSEDDTIITSADIYEGETPKDLLCEGDKAEPAGRVPAEIGATPEPEPSPEEEPRVRQMGSGRGCIRKVSEEKGVELTEVKPRWHPPCAEERVDGARCGAHGN